VISVVARFVQYVPTCLAVLVFRRRDRSSAAAATERFRVPLGPTIPLLSVLLCLWLLTQTEGLKLAAGAGAFALGVPFYLTFCRKRR
jgi:hypothetical protein